MFIQAVPDTLKSNLESLGKEKFVTQFYLAGGTALALQLGHRISYDLDFFTSQSFHEKRMREHLRKLGKLKVETLEEATFLGTLNGSKISLFFYRYPLIFPTVLWKGIRIADIREIGAMKIDALQSRGKKRDFVDLWALLRHGVRLPKLLSYFKKKYRGVDYNYQHILKSLTYFDDAEKDEMPEMLISISWGEIKKTIKNRVKESAGLIR